MSSKAPSSNGSSTKSTATPGHMVALPSVSSSLSQLTQAKSVDAVALHPFPLAAHHTAESEAKLRKVLSNSNSSGTRTPVPSAYAPVPSASYSPGSSDPPIMMRKPNKTKIQV